MAETICQNGSNQSRLDLLPILCVVNTGLLEFYTMDKIGYPVIKNYDNKLVVVDFPNVTNFRLITPFTASSFYNLNRFICPPVGKCKFFNIKKQASNV